MGDRKISIRTSVLEEKATACNMLCCYADELKDGFYPYVEQVCSVLSTLTLHRQSRSASQVVAGVMRKDSAANTLHMRGHCTAD